jgi:TPR repeat protein
MRRQDIQLLANARRGDPVARCELGRKYLRGEDGVPRHVSTGLEYLSHPSASTSAQAARVIAEALALQEIVRFGQVDALRLAAGDGSVVARSKLALWLCVTGGDVGEAKAHLQLAAKQGSSIALAALRALARRSPTSALEGLLEAYKAQPDVDTTAVVHLAVADALAARDAKRLSAMLTVLLRRGSQARSALADTVCQALVEAQHLTEFRLEDLGDLVEPLLDDCVWRGNVDAALLLGLALCGVECGTLRPRVLAAGQNMRKGSALLLRAADAGKQEAWMHLYRVHSDQRVSVANPLMARFFLEKAALGGNTLAQRLLGALILRSAASIHESEHGIHWLHQASVRGDLQAAHLLQSLVLPVQGDESRASAVIDAIGRDDPWMASRLRTARDFGLTKLEALSVDVVEGRRPWGLVIGHNPFVLQPKLAAPRAVPALTQEVGERLYRAAALFEQASQRGPGLEGDIRRRQKRLRLLLDRYGADERWFMSGASATALQSLRVGAKWAFNTHEPLKAALAA